MSDQQNEQRLFIAAENGDYEQLHTLLKEFKYIDINISDRYNYEKTLLHKACVCSVDGGNYLQVVELLLAHGADVNSTDRYGETPLHNACGNRTIDLNIIKLLINNNAEINFKVGRALPPLLTRRQDLSLINNNVLIWNNVRYNNNAEIYIYDGGALPPLLTACIKGRVDVVRLLIENNAEINIKDTDGYTAILYACRYGHVDTVQLLIDNNADVNSKTDNGWTPLLLACFNGGTDISGGGTDIVKLLLRNGADMSIRASNNDTAEELARQCGNDEIVEVFQHFMEMRRQSFSWLKKKRQKRPRSV